MNKKCGGVGGGIGETFIRVGGSSRAIKFLPHVQTEMNFTA